MTTHHVLGLSGGKDSAALAVYMRLNHPELDIDYFFTDTGKELPEVYDFLGRLEGFLGKPIKRLNPDRDFDFWLRQYGHFLPSANTRWCTRKLKLDPFKQWIRPWLAAKEKVYSYVAIRADEEHREGMVAQDDNLIVRLPFREAGVDKLGVLEILEGSGLGLPKYYEWRSRSGCTFCFFQQKIEWVRLKRTHPDAFEAAKAYEKTALEHGSPFTWTQRESLDQLEMPDRMAQIEADFNVRAERDKASRKPNPLRISVAEPVDIDGLYLEDEGGGLGAQHGAGPALVGLELVEGRLDLPPLGVRDGEVDRGGVVRVEDRGEQPVAVVVGSAVVDLVVDDPDDQRFGGHPRVVGGAKLSQPGPIGKGLDRTRLEHRRRPPQQVRAGRRGP